MSDKILKIVSRYIYDSRGNPTVEVDLWTSKGTSRPSSHRLIFFPALEKPQTKISGESFLLPADTDWREREEKRLFDKIRP